ncbi:thiamine pyrophosphokinase [Streptococcus bovimastitidis]|uniref:Thiamine diphosphokinase n=1 Tax=Streptococcus bovimastitidis TaxID=1856638 RepID=A0A1L8MLX4_9STRE|nr:thiamine diphosphokinase [Streptococcus bovimastitidis]OJF71753.1 thiamine pyrophosphokinase [Streptococcus bovimastitidis]
MPKIALVAGGDFSGIFGEFDYFVGIDRGNLHLMAGNFPIDYAIGDFDSVSAQELSDIKVRAKKFQQAPAEKNDTDTELALKMIFQEFPDAQVTIFAAFGGRLDHLMSNLYLPSDPEIEPFMSQIQLMDAQNIVQFRPSGSHLVEEVKGMKYVSFMSESQSPLTIRGAKYDLDASNYFQKKVYSSNEFIGQAIEVSTQTGYIIIIQSKDRS